MTGESRREGSSWRLAAGNAPPRRLPERLGPYVLGDELGRGSLAVVMRGEHEALGRTAAVKILLRVTQSLFTERFKREAHLAASLNHPNIVSVYDTGVDDGWHWLGMELVDGPHLSAHIAAAGGRLTLKRSLEVAIAIARALAFANDAGVIHRDVKPKNILIAPDGVARLADLGLAKVAGSEGVTATGAVLGTPRYMAPEAVTDGATSIDGRADIYSLGLILHEMITGVVPLRGRGKVLTMQRHVREDVPPLSAAEPSVPPALNAVVYRMTARTLEDRYPHAQAVVDDLTAIAEGRRPPSM